MSSCHGFLPEAAPCSVSRSKYRGLGFGVVLVSGYDLALVMTFVLLWSTGIGWRALVHPKTHPVSEYEFEVIIGGDGRRNTLEGTGFCLLSFAWLFTDWRLTRPRDHTPKKLQACCPVSACKGISHRTLGHELLKDVRATAFSVCTDVTGTQHPATLRVTFSTE